MAEPQTRRTTIGWPVLPHYSSNSDEPAIGYPVATGYPLTTPAAANRIKFYVLCTAILIIFVLFVIAVLMFMVPLLPFFSVASTSLTVCGNSRFYYYKGRLDVVFLVESGHTRGTTSYDDITVSEAHDKLQLFNFALCPFEQPHFNRTWSKSWNHTATTSALIEYWVEVSNLESATNGGKAATSLLKLELRGNATFRGRTWVKRRIPIRVVCENVKVQVPSDYTNTTTTLLEFKPMPECRVDRLWGKYLFWLRFLFYGLIILFFVF